MMRFFTAMMMALLTKIDEGSIVSMNCWGFTPAYFDYADQMFKGFLKDSINNNKSEFYIPMLVNNLIESGKMNCKVLPTTAEWFGVTYAGDKPNVVKKISDLIESGVYPSPLWD